MKNRIYINSYGHCCPKDIILFVAKENYTDILFSNGKKLTVATTLKTFENRVTDADFFRVHKSFLINLEHLHGVGKSGGKPYAEMANGFKARIARRKISPLMLKLNN